MQKFSKYFAWAVILLYFALGVYVLVAPRLQYLRREVRVIFAVFLFLYGGFRMARLWTRQRESDEEPED
ncbi:MAG TPA: hypothetical protein PKG48_04190 [Bacteroidales bacterium]|nr:hypothetical protein [Bacteroidales bacterium]HPS63064.1 hypothetical protein [Bacteroidales bacterium]